MKKFLLSTAILLTSAVTFAQTYTLNVHLKNGTTEQFELSDVDRLTFTGTEEEPAPVAAPVKITIPTSFTTSLVQKVMYNGKQVAEIDQEYIKKIGKQVVTIYPCGADGRADLTKGMTSTGASVVWDLEANTATVGEEGEALTTVYVVNGEIVTSFDGKALDGTITPDVINDNRDALNKETYKIVKIGTQYWMAENLRARAFTDGTLLDSYSAADWDAWKANTTGCYYSGNQPEWTQIAGLFYNGYCVTSDKGIAPEGWEVPTTEQLTKLRSAGSLSTANFKSSEFGMWSTGMEGNNITGFDAVATGSYLSGDIQSMYSDSYIWGSTVSTSWLKVEGLVTLRIPGSNSKSVIVSGPDDCHQYTYGHVIRCIRK